jgi:hypothetical protein
MFVAGSPRKGPAGIFLLLLYSVGRKGRQAEGYSLHFCSSFDSSCHAIQTLCHCFSCGPIGLRNGFKTEPVDRFREKALGILLPFRDHLLHLCLHID